MPPPSALLSDTAHPAHAARATRPSSARLALALGLASGLFGAWACRVDEGGPPGVVGPQPQPVHGYELIYEEPCSVEECDRIDRPSEQGVHRCTRAFEAGACRWETGGPNTSVSFSQCEEPRCGARPAIQCPAGLQLGGHTCGSENDEPCRWHTSCGVPPSDVPCPNEECGPAQTIAAICSEDGGFEGPIAEMVCRRTAFGCFWQHECP